MNEEVIGAIITVIAIAAVNLFRLFSKDQAEARLKTIAWATQIAYHVTNEVAKFTATKIDDKVAYAMNIFLEALAKQGVQPTPAETELAKLQWKAMHGQEKTAAALVSMSPQMPPA